MGTPAGIAKNKHSASCYWNAFDDYYRPLDCSKPGVVCCHGHESWCDAVVGSHKDVIDRKTSDGINAQLRCAMPILNTSHCHLLQELVVRAGIFKASCSQSPTRFRTRPPT